MTAQTAAYGQSVEKRIFTQQKESASHSIIMDIGTIPIFYLEEPQNGDTEEDPFWDSLFYFLDMSYRKIIVA